MICGHRVELHLKWWNGCISIWFSGEARLSCGDIWRGDDSCRAQDLGCLERWTWIRGHQLRKHRPFVTNQIINQHTVICHEYHHQHYHFTYCSFFLTTIVLFLMHLFLSFLLQFSSRIFMNIHFHNQQLLLSSFICVPLFPHYFNFMECHQCHHCFKCFVFQGFAPLESTKPQLPQKVLRSLGAAVRKIEISHLQTIKPSHQIWLNKIYRNTRDTIKMHGTVFLVFAQHLASLCGKVEMS